MGGRGASFNSKPIKDMASLYKALDRSANAYWKYEDEDSIFVRDTAEEYRRIADEALEYIGNSPILEPGDYEGSIRWTFSGRDLQTKKFSSFEFSASDRKEARETLAGNGYSVRFLLPSKLYNYAVDRTNMEPETMKVLNAIATQALRERRRR